MKLCIPVTRNEGLDSPVCAHFGSAPLFLVVDTESGDCRAVANGNQHHAHGQCSPLAALAGERFDAMAVGGIGMGALGKLQAAGVRVYRAEGASAASTLAAWRSSVLEELDPSGACVHRGHGQHGHDRGDS